MVTSLISARRAVYPNQFSDEILLMDEVKTILKAANWAPTHKRTEPWRFKVFFSQESRQGLSTFLATTYQKTAHPFSEVKLRKVSEKPLQSGCVIAICFQRDLKEVVPEWEEIAATAMAVQNMWLTAAEGNIGAYWSSPSLKNHLGEYIPLNEGEQCLGFFYMGKVKEPLPAGSRKSGIEEKTVWY